MGWADDFTSPFRRRPRSLFGGEVIAACQRMLITVIERTLRRGFAEPR